MGKEFLGFILIIWAISNAVMWLLGIGLEIKYKLIIPQAITIFCVIFGIGSYLIGL